MLPSRSHADTAPLDSASTLGSETLANSLRLDFVDLSNRYFGDYHRLRIQLTISFDLHETSLSDLPLLAAARERFGQTFSTVRFLERMGVASADVETVRREMVESCLAESRRYLAGAAAPERLLRAELEKKRRVTPG